MSKTPTLILLGLLSVGCKGWPYRAPDSSARSRPLATAPVRAPLPRYVVVDERISDLDVLRDWMGEPEDEVREYFKRWYLERHKDDPRAESLAELVEVLEGPRRRALASIFSEDPERFRVPKLGLPQPGDEDF